MNDLGGSLLFHMSALPCGAPKMAEGARQKVACTFRRARANSVLFRMSILYITISSLYIWVGVRSDDTDKSKHGNDSKEHKAGEKTKRTIETCVGHTLQTLHFHLSQFVHVHAVGDTARRVA